MTAASGFSQRIVCLTEETTETLYRLGEDWRIVGISGFTVRPPRARREKPRVSAFTSARTDRIVALRPDLVLGFSDLQADIAAELVRAGLEVHVFNHRSVADILRMIRTLGGMISGIQWVSELVQLAGGEECSPSSRARGWGAIASSPIRWKCHAALPTSCSARGAARSSSRSAWLRGPAGTPSPRCATATCARSSQRSSCSRGLQR